MSTEENKAVVLRLYEMLNRHELDQLAAVYDEQGIDHGAPPGTPAGLDSFRNVMSMLMTAFPDLHWQQDDLIAEEDKVVTRTTFSGTLQGPFFGRPPTGKHFSIQTIHL